MTVRLTKWWPFPTDLFAVAEGRFTDRQGMSRIRFLNYLWFNDGRLPLESDALTRIARNPPKVWLAVMGEFDMSRDGWTHPELTAELERSKSVSAERRQAAMQRWSKSNAIASANAMPSDVVSCSDRSVVAEPSERGSANKEDSERGSAGKTTAKVVPLRGEAS